MTINSIDIEGSHTVTAENRLAWAAALVERRLAEAQELRGAAGETLPVRWVGPATEAHVYGNVAALVQDEECFLHLLYLARHGADGGVAVLWHGDLDEITVVLTAKSGALASALIEGRSFRHVTPARRT